VLRKLLSVLRDLMRKMEVPFDIHRLCDCLVLLGVTSQQSLKAIYGLFDAVIHLVTVITTSGSDLEV
jgi:hypothetical protein